MNLTLTPKKHFQEKVEFASLHRDLAVATNFREALHASLLDQVLALPTVYEPNQAAAHYHQIMGAREFINHLLNIAEKAGSPPGKPKTNLDHSIR